MLRGSALHIQSHALSSTRSPGMARGCGAACGHHPTGATHRGQGHEAQPHVTHTAEQEGALLGMAMALWAGPRDVSPGVTTQGTWHCHLQQHLGLGESQGKEQMCWQLRGVSRPLSSPRSVHSPHKPRMAKRWEGLMDRENLQAHSAGREV